jgi:hypothetical protein
MSFDKGRGSSSYVKSGGPPIAGSEPKWTARIPFGRRSSLLLASGSVALLSGCADRGQSFLTPSGPVSALEYHHLWLITLVRLIVVAPVIVGVPLLA